MVRLTRRLRSCGKPPGHEQNDRDGAAPLSGRPTGPMLGRRSLRRSGLAAGVTPSTRRGGRFHAPPPTWPQARAVRAPMNTVVSGRPAGKCPFPPAGLFVARGRRRGWYVREGQRKTRRTGAPPGLCTPAGGWPGECTTTRPALEGRPHRSWRIGSVGWDTGPGRFYTLPIWNGRIQSSACRTGNPAHTDRPGRGERVAAGLSSCPPSISR